MKQQRKFTKLVVIGLIALAAACSPPEAWAAPEATPAVTSPTDGAVLAPGNGVRSPDGQHLLVHQHDGNVVLYGPNGGIWQTRTAGRDTSRFAFQSDGNLVLYDVAGAPIWHTATHGRGDVLAVQDDANVVVYDGSAPVWAIKGMTPPLDVRGSTGDGCGGWQHTVAHYFGWETPRACRVLLCESKGDRYAHNPTSSASGLWQFLDGTWRSVTGQPPEARDYSPSYQTWAAKRLRDTGGWGHWSCR